MFEFNLAIWEKDYFHMTTYLGAIVTISSDRKLEAFEVEGEYEDIELELKETMNDYDVEELRHAVLDKLCEKLNATWKLLEFDGEIERDFDDDDED